MNEFHIFVSGSLTPSLNVFFASIQPNDLMKVSVFLCVLRQSFFFSFCLLCPSPFPSTLSIYFSPPLSSKRSFSLYFASFLILVVSPLLLSHFRSSVFCCLLPLYSFSLIGSFSHSCSFSFFFFCFILSFSM